MSCHRYRARTLSSGEFTSPRGGVKPPPPHHYPLRADHEANEKAKGKGQRAKMQQPPDFRFSNFDFPITNFHFPYSRPSYLLEMKVRAVISFRINEGKFRRGTFLRFLGRQRTYSLKS